MNIINNTNVIGKVGADAVIIPPTPKKPNQILTFDLSVLKSYTDTSTGEKKNKVIWYNVVIFFPKKKSIKLIDFLKKGKLVAINGEVSPLAWIDSETKEIKTKLRITVSPGEIALL